MESRGKKGKPTVTGTPKHSRDGLDSDLFDTPGLDEHLKPIKNKRLKKCVGDATKSVVIQLGMDVGSAKESGYVKAKNVVGGKGDDKDRWSEEEVEEEEKEFVYGFPLSILKRYGVKKKHVKNVNRVKKLYPGLEFAMDCICTDSATVEEVAEAIRAVPMMG
jgi:hypothetical protein